MINGNVIHPSHYNDGKIEVLEFIEDKGLGFHLGNAVKYICRAGKKDKAKEIEDLEKAANYINLYIKYLQRQGSGEVKEPYENINMDGTPVGLMRSHE